MYDALSWTDCVKGIGVNNSSHSKEDDMKKWDEIIKLFGTKDFRNLASEMKAEWAHDFKKVVKNLKKIDLETINHHPAVENVRENIGQAIHRVQDLEIVEYAKSKVEDTKNQVLSALDIPSKGEVATLTRKLVALEKKFKTVRRHINK